MRLSVISFTEQGQALGERIRECMGGPADEIVLYTKCSRTEDPHCHGAQQVAVSLTEWAGQQMAEHGAILFLGACGIAVRAIAPWITDKLHDSPVLVADEMGRYVIPLLSGHVGGANEMADRLAAAIGAIPVITTATDIQGRFAVDLFAKRNHLRILNKEGIAHVSSKILAGEEITMSIQTGHSAEGEAAPAQIRLCDYPPAEQVDVLITEENALPQGRAQLSLQPKKYILGVGCKKGTDGSGLEAFLTKTMQKAGICVEQVAAVASIDVKKEENGILQFCGKNRIPFLTYAAEKLQAVPGEFHGSAFVKERVGVDNVCERAAVCAAGEGGRLYLEKQAEAGMTAAVAEREWKVCFHEE